MTSRPIRCIALASILVLAVPAVRAGATQQVANPSVVALLNQSQQAIKELRIDDAHKLADEAQALAEKLGDRLGLALSYEKKAGVLFAQSLAKEAIAWHQRAADGFEQLGDQAGLAHALQGILAAKIVLGDTNGLRELADRAITLYQALGNERGRAIVISNLMRSNVSPAQNASWGQELLNIGTKLADNMLIGEALLLRAGGEFEAGNLAAARASYEQAIPVIERDGDVRSVATAYLSFGRVFRAHGDYEGAIQRYQKAIDLLLPTRERYAIVQAINAKAIALAALNRQKEAIAAYEQGLALAREGGNPRMIDFMEGNLAGGLSFAGEYERAIPLLQAIIAKKPDQSTLGYRYSALATSLLGLGRLSEAVEPRNESVRIARELKQVEVLGNRLSDRAILFSKLGRFEDALADVRESVGIVEDIRTKLIPIDFLKRGYGDRVQRGYAQIVDLLAQLGRSTEALEFSEQGRTRAFLDLLAARESSDATLTVRGEPSTGTRPAASLASESIGHPATAAEMSRTAARLNSTVVSYFVTDDATLAFVVRADASPAMVRIPIKRVKLNDLVAATTAPLRASGTTATRGTAPEEDLTSLPMRGLGLLALSRDDRSAWRELYKTLIEPVRAQLPARGGRMVVVPNGPLLQLSFAALQNASGRYLIEDYELSYAPSISVLEFTGRRQEAANSNFGSLWALVGNPVSLPVVGKGSLPALPGAAREIASIAALAPAGSKVVRIDGAGADESAVVRALDTSRPSLLHFATHGFVFDDPRQAPFLALNRRGTDAANDGRLTLDEVYNLRLTTDLVVLSACRTGAGKVNSDGVIGLTRGFFYAGTASVLATFWDVADETTSILMTSFYRGYARDRSKGPSLRQAQLALLADLRAGKVVVTAGGRRVTLPEHPLLWAAFFLSGEP